MDSKIKAREIKKIKDAKKKGEIYISPEIFGENAIFIQGILNGVRNINLNVEGDSDDD